MFNVLAAGRPDILESGTILGVFADDKYGGGGYFQVALQKGESGEARTGKLTFANFLRFYNSERVADFRTPAPPEPEPGPLSITSAASAEQDIAAGGLVEAIQAAEPNLDPSFTSYLAEFVQRKGVNQIREVAGKFTDKTRSLLRDEISRNNLAGLIYRLELIFEQQTDPHYSEKETRHIDDMFSGDPKRVRQTTAEIVSRFGDHVALTNRHLKHSKSIEPNEYLTSKELEVLLRKMIGKY